MKQHFEHEATAREVLMAIGYLLILIVGMVVSLVVGVAPMESPVMAVAALHASGAG
jgi:hypothetical protein